MNWAAFFIAYGSIGMLVFLLGILSADFDDNDRMKRFFFLAFMSAFVAVCIGIGLGV